MGMNTVIKDMQNTLLTNYYIEKIIGIIVITAIIAGIVILIKKRKK